MKVLWLYSDLECGSYYSYNHGVGDLDAILRQNGHDSELLYLRERSDEIDLAESIRKACPDAILIPLNTHQWLHVKRLAHSIKEVANVPFIAGGIHPICAPEEVISHPCIDYVCIGEGDTSLPNLLREIEGNGAGHRVPGFWGKYNDELFKSSPAPLVEDLDSIPFSKREIWDMRRVLLDSEYEVSIMAGRGCPYNCTYCANSAKKTALKECGKYIRLRSPENTIKHISLLRELYHFKSVFIEDDIFTLDKKWAYKFLELYKKTFNYPLKVYIHVNNVDRDILRTLKESGCYMVMAGVETGNDEIRESLLGRKITNERLMEVFGLCDELGLKTTAFNILGLPGETLESIRNLMDLNRKLNPNFAQVTLFYPYKGTALYYKCEKEDLLTGRERASYFDKSVLNLPTISGDELTRSFDDFRGFSKSIKATKEKRGYFDLLANLEDADFDVSETEPARLLDTNIWGDRRLTLLLHPRAKAGWRTNILPGTIFKGAIALDPVCLDWGGRGANFIIRISTDEISNVLFERYIDPKSKPWQNRWHEFEIDLDRFKGPAELILETYPHKSGDLHGAWAVFAKPYLEQV